MLLHYGRPAKAASEENMEISASVIRRIAIFLTVLLFSSCATTTKLDTIGTPLDSRGSDCKVDFYKDGNPSRAYRVIGKIESHIVKNIFFGRKANLENDAYEELRQKACELGGEGVIINDSVESSAAELTHVHVWATVLRYE